MVATKIAINEDVRSNGFCNLKVVEFVICISVEEIGCSMAIPVHN